MNEKNIIMCLTTGRSGTKLFGMLLGLADDTCSLHEPAPAFQSVISKVRLDPDAAVDFVKNQKLPSIISQKCRNYAETSHLFGKGFFEAFVALHVPFRLVILNRNPRSVAKSLWRLNTVPGRTKSGNDFLLDPRQEDVLCLPNWEKLSDYQLCYWYCLEMERRKSYYLEECKKYKIPCIEISTEQLKDWKSFQAICGQLDLHLQESARKKHLELTSKKINHKGKHLPRFSLIPLRLQENQVWQALGEQAEKIRAIVTTRYDAAA